jgi:phosphoribosylformimino-5-aminoimidazole carboxamide ribotide isomerase
MQIYPAIDLRDGQCVRLRQGDYEQETVFDSDPVAAARRWVDQGATWLHLVDLDGAKAGRPVNRSVIQKIVQAVPVPCQLGGGLRSREHVADALADGVRRVILGTRAVADLEGFGELCGRHPNQVALGLDCREGRVATNGWLETSSATAIELAQRVSAWPVAAIIFTDIGRDGMLMGPNLSALAELARSVHLPVIASGGVTTADDVRAVARLGVAGCIIGRALYEGRLSLSDALQSTRTG